MSHQDGSQDDVTWSLHNLLIWSSHGQHMIYSYGLLTDFRELLVVELIGDAKVLHAGEQQH